MGRLMVEQLLAGGHSVTMSNRGVSANPFAGDSRVRLLQCDRMEEREKFIGLISTAAAERPFNAVIDFTGFHRDYIRDTIKALHTVSETEVVRNVVHCKLPPPPHTHTRPQPV